MPVPRVEGSHVVANGKLYVFGGFNVALDVTAETDAYDPATNTWARLADMPIKETDGSAAYDPQTNTVYIAGMQVGDDDGPPTADMLEYHIDTNTWTKGPPLPSARAAGGLVLVGRKLHFFGGINGARNADVPDHVVLDVDHPMTWAPAAALPDARNHLAGVALNGKIYAIGGHHAQAEQTTSQSELDVYDPATDQWTKVASLPLARGHINPSSFAAGGRIYVVGGQADGERFLSNVTVYDPATNEWTDLAPLPGPLTAPMADAINGSLIVTGGHASVNGPVSNQTLIRPLA
jgi:N-acetylneuraminic acid mutarotase